MPLNFLFCYHFVIHISFHSDSCPFFFLNFPYVIADTSLRSQDLLNAELFPEKFVVMGTEITRSQEVGGGADYNYVYRRERIFRVPGEIKTSRDLRGGRWSWTLT